MFSLILSRNLSKFSSEIPKNSRTLFEWLNVVFNAVDKEKIRAHGPDYAATEWLIRNGASVVWSSDVKDQNFNDYDKLMEKNEEFSGKNNSIVKIDATNSSINHLGFDYLNHLQHLSVIIFDNTRLLNDKALVKLTRCKLPELKHLEIRNCQDVTDNGVTALKELRTLKYLKLENLYSIKDRSMCREILRKSLPIDCRIEWN